MSTVFKLREQKKGKLTGGKSFFTTKDEVNKKTKILDQMRKNNKRII